MRAWVKRHPVSSYFVMAYTLSWSIAIPLALQAQGVFAVRLPWALHYLTAFGPAVAALTIAWVLREPLGTGRSVRWNAVRHPAVWWAVGFGSPLLLFAIAQLAADLAGQSAPSWSSLGRVNFLPDLVPRTGRSVIVRDGRFEEIVDANQPAPVGTRVIDAAGKVLIPGLIDAHVHLLSDSGPDLLTRRTALMREWLATTREYPQGRDEIVRRGQLKLKAGVTTLRILGDGYYALRCRDDLARWDVVGPRVLAAGLHVNGPNGYVSGGNVVELSPAAA